MSVLDGFRLEGRLAVVTGAGRGIGAGIAIALAEAGADIIGVSRTIADDGGDVGAAVRALGREFTPMRADLASLDAVRDLVATLDASERHVDILVNNAGLAERNPAELHTDEQWQTVLTVDLTAPFALARDLGKRMLHRGEGKIIFLASMMTYQGGVNVVSYAAAKSGVAGVVHALANEWAARGVNVNAVAPGYIETDLTSASHGDPVRRQAFIERIPAGRWGRPDDLAGAIVFLASPASDYIHGAILPVDGGWLVR